MKLRTVGLPGLLLLVHQLASATCILPYNTYTNKAGYWNSCDHCVKATFNMCGTLEPWWFHANQKLLLDLCPGAIEPLAEESCSRKGKVGRDPVTTNESQARKEQALPTKGGILVYTYPKLGMTVARSASNEATTGATCSAHNEVGDTCTASCEPGQVAQCRNTIGASTPDCSCK